MSCGWKNVRDIASVGGRENVQKGVTCGISQMARWGLTRLRQKRLYKDKHEFELAKALGVMVEFRDACVVFETPRVPAHLLGQLHAIDGNLFLCWELQFYFEHRWHVKLRDQGEEKSILLLQDPPYPIKASQVRAEYVPFDTLALDDVRRLMHQFRHGRQKAVVTAHLSRLAQKQERKERDRMGLAFDVDSAYRRVHERIRGERNISDPGWERGIGHDGSGKPMVVGKGAHAGRKRAI